MTKICQEFDQKFDKYCFGEIKMKFVCHDEIQMTFDLHHFYKILVKNLNENLYENLYENLNEDFVQISIKI